jgi:hypothetical protein
MICFLGGFIWRRERVRLGLCMCLISKRGLFWSDYDRIWSSWWVSRGRLLVSRLVYRSFLKIFTSIGQSRVKDGRSVLIFYLVHTLLLFVIVIHLVHSQRSGYQLNEYWYRMDTH